MSFEKVSLLSNVVAEHPVRRSVPRMLVNIAVFLSFCLEE